MKTRFILVCTLALLISACAAPAASQPIDTVISTDEIVFTPVTPPTSENLPATTMTTYADDLAGFLLDYPAGWFVESSVLAHAEESFSYSINISSWDILNPPPASERQPNGLPYGATKFDVIVTKNATTLEAAVEEVRGAGTPILAQREITLANGVPGIILDFDSFAGQARMLISILNGNIIYVTGYGDLEPFESIALSLRSR